MARATNSTSMAMLGYEENYGNVSISCPFGIGANCYHESWYEIICYKYFSPPKPCLRRLNLEIGFDNKAIPISYTFMAAALMANSFATIDPAWSA
ncbi:hypothetical protein Nepgr_001750 [Nepenthes gracilis]|uniref:Uncharacterized protein n=1 Tax=Nepenthes gracilis TaxID=150966 RepID=A0AAD3P5K3_NEPGR|nr:hypothetical protein Nepgr_001750 [Nepenthes gracilis]